MHTFVGRDIVSIKDLSRAELEHIIEVATTMVKYAEGKEASDLLAGHILSTLFFEPSTRTRLSFECAMLRLGGKVLGFSNLESTSVVKGETLADTIKMVECYSDVIVLRHPQEGAARLAAELTSKPIINAGDGAGQHPTQTIQDLFTIKTELGQIENKHIVLLGDLKYGRTVHSLAYALALFGAKIYLVAPAGLELPPEVISTLQHELNSKPEEYQTIEEIIEVADVLYVTRIQKERFPDITEYLKVAGKYRINSEILSRAKPELIVMHPLPRTDEIDPEVDTTPHAKYFRQAFNGIPVRMALLSLVLGKLS